MPVFSCGGMRFQQSWTDSGQPIEPEAQARLEATVRSGIQRGITHVETARGYGTSERQLGMLLPQLDRDSLILQTKVAPSPDPHRFEAHVRQSLDRLQVERVDLLALHGVNSYEKLWWSLRPGGCLQVARRLQREGKVGHVGLSTHGSLELILAAIQHPDHDGFDYINLHWYFINQTNWPAIEAATAADMGVFIISPSDKGGRLYDPPERLSALCAPLHPLVFNALFCLSRPEVHTLSIGAARPDDFDLALTALDHLPQAQRTLAAPEQRLAAAMAEALGPDVWPRLTDGLPAWDHCPGLVNVSVILRLRALSLAWGMQEYARWRYNMLGHASDWFPGMDARDVADLDFTAALPDSPFREQIPGWLAEAHEMLSGRKQQRLSGG